MAEAYCIYAVAVLDSIQRIVMKGNEHFMSVPYAANATRIFPDYLIGDREALPTYPIHPGTRDTTASRGQVVGDRIRVWFWCCHKYD